MLSANTFVQEPIQLLAVVDRRIGHLVAPDQLVLGIRIHVVLVPEKTLAVLLRPARVVILLAQFGRLVVPRLRYPSALHRLVLVTTVALLGDRHDHLIPLVLFAAMGRQPSIKVFGSDYPT